MPNIFFEIFLYLLLGLQNLHSSLNIRITRLRRCQDSKGLGHQHPEDIHTTLRKSTMKLLKVSSTSMWKPMKLWWQDEMISRVESSPLNLMLSILSVTLLNDSSDAIQGFSSDEWCFDHNHSILRFSKLSSTSTLRCLSIRTPKWLDAKASWAWVKIYSIQSILDFKSLRCLQESLKS